VSKKNTIETVNTGAAAEAQATSATPRTFKRLRAVSRGIYWFQKRETVIVKIDAPISYGKANKDGHRSASCDITTVEDGVIYTGMFGGDLAPTLENAYPDNSYVGKYFAITNNGKLPGKDEYSFAVEEVVPE